MSRIYVFTGKGGVGKTSVAAAHAVKSADKGDKTLLVSTDMAHNLGDLFEIKIGRDLVPVNDKLDLYEIDPNYVMENDFKDMVECLAKMIPGGEGQSMLDFGMMPGMEELFSLLKINDIYKSGKYERIFVDCAPTGETLSLLKFPELLAWYMERFFPVGKVAVRVLSPVAKHMFKVELPNKAAMTDIEKMYLKMLELQEMLKDRETTSIRLVCTPEKMVVEETKRNYMYMNLYDFNVDGLYINRILGDKVDNEFFTKWKEIQRKYVEQLQQAFKGIPIEYVPWYDSEIRGMDAVERVANEALPENVFEAKVITEREHFEENEDGYELTVHVPNVNKEDMELFQAQSDVVIRIGNYKRNIPLPNSLRKYEIAGAKFDEDVLKIQFVKGED